MCKRVASFDRRVEVIVQVVDVHVSVREGTTRCDVEVPNHFVHADDAFNAAAFLALCVESLAVAFSFALLDAFATPEGPAISSICFPHFVTCVAAACLP